jgi:hypothetical protein
MKRSGSVTAAVVVLLLGSAILALIALATALAIPVVTSKAPSAPYLPGTFVVAIAFYLALAGWGVTTALGLLRLRPWARISILSMSVLALVICFGSVVSVLILFPNIPDQYDPHIKAVVRGVLIVSLSFPMGIAVWWLVLFLRRGVKQQFGGAAGETLEAPPSGGRPVSITLIAICFLLSAPQMLWMLYLTFPTRPTGIPTMVLGTWISGWGATAFCLAILAAVLTLGLGLWRMRPWARTGAIAYSVFTMLNNITMALRPDSFTRIFATMRPANPALASYPIPQGFLWFIVLFGAGLPAVALWFLIKRKASFAH